MAGVKGKTGVGKNPKKGRKEHTNNPNGRPKGATNKIQSSVKCRIVEFINNDFDNLIDEIKGLENKEKVKAKIELVKLVVPRPLNESEEDSNKTQSELMKRLFGA